MEFGAELSDLIHEDLDKFLPALISKVLITVYDVAPKALGYLMKGSRNSP